MNLYRKSLLPLAISIATASISGTVLSQDNTVQQIEEITVTGYLRQARESLAAKQNEPRIADFLSQDELGRQPDLNVADSLRRLPSSWLPS